MALLSFDRTKTQAQAVAASSDKNTVFFTTDTHKIITNDQIYGGGDVSVISVNGTTHSPVDGVITFNTPDTKNTAGASGTTSQLYLIGATSKDSSIVTNTSTTDVYMTNGSLYGSAFYETSDERLKNIRREIDLEKAYQLLDKCQTIIYDLKSDESHTEQIGMIAQEVEEFFPEIISTDSDGMKSLDYSRLTVILFRVIKDLITRIEKLEK